MPGEDEQLPFNTSVAHPARVYNYWLGGKDNFAVDREAGDRALAGGAKILPGVRANRAFLRRAVRYLVAEAGVRQFLDIGSGLPATNNVHEVAQRADLSCRVVYVDSDPSVLPHARALLASAPEGRTGYLTPCRPAATSPRRTPRRSMTRMAGRRPSRPTARPPWASSATPTNSPAWPSAASSSCRRASSSSRNGVPTSPARVRCPLRSAATGEWRASPDIWSCSGEFGW